MKINIIRKKIGKNSQKTFLYDPSQMILKPSQSPKKKPPGRTSFIQRKDTRTSFIGVSGNSSGNSSDEEQRPTRVTFTGRKTIGEKASIDDDLEDILAIKHIYFSP